MKKSELKLWNRITEARKYFTRKEYAAIVERARELFERGVFDLCEKELEKLPSNADLLEKLISKLQDKRIYKTLRKIEEGKVQTISMAKGLSSLLTHVIIEVEHGNHEYKILIPNIYEKLNEIIYNTLQ